MRRTRNACCPLERRHHPCRGAKEATRGGHPTWDYLSLSGVHGVALKRYMTKGLRISSLELKLVIFPAAKDATCITTVLRGGNASGTRCAGHL